MSLAEVITPELDTPPNNELASLLGGGEIRRGDYALSIAQTSEDARAITASIRSAWGLDEKVVYFYKIFNEPEQLFHELVLPTLNATAFGEIESICLVAKQGGAPVGTGSLILNHAQRTIEFGRAGTMPKHQGNGVLDAVTDARMLLATNLRSKFSLISDSTTLSHAVQHRLQSRGLNAVAFHPSSFVIQPNRVDQWLELLSQKHSPDIAASMLVQSQRSGMGRFGTFFHFSPSTSRTQFKKPVLTTSLEPYYALTRKILTIPGGDILQTAAETHMETHDNPLTATRMVTNPSREAILDSIAQAASKEGFDTLIVQVPCADFESLQTLEDRGFAIAGVFPNKDGDWVASFVYIVDDAEHARTVDALGRLSQDRFASIAVEENTQLVALVYSAMEKSTNKRV